MANKKPVNFEDLLENLIEFNTKDYQRIKKLVKKTANDIAVPPLIIALKNATDARTFSRIATALTELGGEEAFEALREQARSNKQFPMISVNALARCKHPQTIPFLLDLMEHGRRIKQRQAAAKALGNLQVVLAIEKLCRAVAHNEGNIAPEALQALKKMGKTELLIRRVLQEPLMSVQDRVRTIKLLTYLSKMIGFNSPFYSFSLWGEFDPLKFLAREIANKNNPFREQAKAVLNLLIAESTLLRPSQADPGEYLLRPAKGIKNLPTDQLLRPSEGMDEELALLNEEVEKESWWKRIFPFLHRKED